MKILLVGAGGTIGSAVDKELSQRHEVIRIGRNSGDFQVDISDSASIRQLFEKPASSTHWCAPPATSPSHRSVR